MNIKPLFQRHQQNLFIKEPSVLFLNVSSRLLLNQQEWRIYVLSHIRSRCLHLLLYVTVRLVQSCPSEAGRHCNGRRYCCQQLWDCCDGADDLINRETIKISHQYNVNNLEIISCFCCMSEKETEAVDLIFTENDEVWNHLVRSKKRVKLCQIEVNNETIEPNRHSSVDSIAEVH